MARALRELYTHQSKTRCVSVVALYFVTRIVVDVLANVLAVCSPRDTCHAAPTPVSVPAPRLPEHSAGIPLDLFGAAGLSFPPSATPAAAAGPPANASAASAASAAQATPSRVAAPTGTVTVPEAKLQALMAMGFPRDQAAEALMVCNMDEALAAAFLLGST